MINMTNEFRNNNKSIMKNQLRKLFITLFPKRNDSINRLRNANCSELEEILKTIWHIQSTYEQNLHCLLLLNFPAD